MKKSLPFSKRDIIQIAKKHPTPFHIYDEERMRENAREFKKAFSILPGFKEFFSVKALPNPFIMKIMKEEGFGADCSSMGELILSEKVGIIGEDIMFSSNDTPIKEYKKAKELGAIINLDDISHIEFLEQIGLPELLCFRYNPGAARKGNHIIGHPEEAKYGFTKQQIFEGLALARKKGVNRFGIHTMVVSNELHESHFFETAIMMFDLAFEIFERMGIVLEFVNFGGGIGIPYLPNEKPVDYQKLAKGMKRIHGRILPPALRKMNIFFECGRVITGPYGYLVTTALHMKHIYKDYVGVDACMANLMRPGMYGAYHHITVLGKETKKNNRTYDVVGSLCENNDKFAIDRKLPNVVPGDILVIHDTGAHGHSMGFNYNAKLRSAELLLRPNGNVVEIRRAETMDDYFSTLDFKKVKTFH